MSAFGRILVAALAWGVLAFGAVYPWAYWPLFITSAALGAWAIRTTQAWRDPRLRRLGVAIGVLLAAGGVQVIALPAWLIARLSPAVDRFFRDYEVGYHPAALHTLSLVPGATWVVLVEIVAFGLLLVGTARMVRRLPLDWLVSQLMGLGVAVAVIGILQKAFVAADRPMVYGVWRPLQGGNPFGPFVNRNHFAGWMVMVLPVVVAYSWAVVQRADREVVGERAGWFRWVGTVEGNRFLLIATSALIMGVSVVLTGSRSGMASLAVAAVALGAFVVRRLGGRTRRLAAAAYLGLMLVGAVSWAGMDLVVGRFERAPGEVQGRLVAWRDTVRMIADFPVFGAGLGGYGHAMLVYQTADRARMYAQAHNDYLQLAAEGGVLVVVPALVVVGILAGGIRRRLVMADDDALTYWVRRGAVCGLLGIAAQSLVEFSLQMPGNAVLCVVLVALAVHRPRSLTHANRV